MKLKTLILSNFRGFPQLDIEFGERITVLAGVNGSGKSAILRAIACLLSNLLREVSPSKETPEPLSAADVHIGKPVLTISATFASNEKTFHSQLTRAIPDPTKAAEYAERRDKARFAIRETTKGSKQEKELLEQIRYLTALLEQDKDHFSHQIEVKEQRGKTPKRNATSQPFAVLYSTSRYLGRLPLRLRHRPIEPASAYFSALSGTEVSLGAFAIWLKAGVAGELGSRAASKRLLAHLSKVVSTLLPGFSDLRLDEPPPSPREGTRPKPRLYVKKGKTEFELNQLSDGERGLLALAFDLTRRLATANPKLKDPVAESQAIVLLDEIELHLHPSWQRKVLARLMETFKNCQFIATTHSPQVLGETPPGSVWMLDFDKGQMLAWKPDRIFGMDSNRLLEELMETDSLNTGVKKKLQMVADLVDKDSFTKAKAMIGSLEPQLGADHPELIRLRALISFITPKK